LFWPKNVRLRANPRSVRSRTRKPARTLHSLGQPYQGSSAARDGDGVKPIGFVLPNREPPAERVYSAGPRAANDRLCSAKSAWRPWGSQLASELSCPCIWNRCAFPFGFVLPNRLSRPRDQLASALSQPCIEIVALFHLGLFSQTTDGRVGRGAMASRTPW